jgi:hypothetical protein
MLSTLELLYVTIRRIQQDYAEGAPRANPMLVLVFLLAPVFYSLLHFIPGSAMVDEAANASFWSSVSPLRYLGIALAFLFSWRCFDKRRDQIDSRFLAWPRLTTPKNIGIGVASFALVSLLTYLSFDYPLGCVAVFLAISALASMWIRVSGLRRSRVDGSN